MGWNIDKKSSPMKRSDRSVLRAYVISELAKRASSVMFVFN